MSKKNLTKNKQYAVESEEHSQSSLGRIVWVSVVVAIAISIPYLLKSELTKKNDNLASSNNGGKSGSDAKQKMQRPRKLNSFGEYEDMFDHSAEVNNWDIYRSPNPTDQLIWLFSIYDQGNFQKAKDEFHTALRSEPNSFWLRYGAAIAADQVAELGQTNRFLEDAIEYYSAFCELHSNLKAMSHIEREAEINACRRLSDRLSFRGWSRKAIDVLTDLSERFPNEKSVQHDVGIQLVMTGQYEKAKRLFQMLFDADPNDGMAAVHLGFILKTIESDYENAAPFLIAGIQSGSPGVRDGRYYYHLGDALVRLGRPEEAEKWYEEAYQYGLFLKPNQRALYSVAGLRAKPWWTLGASGHGTELKKIQSHWKEIRQEALANLDEETGLFKPEDEKLRDFGDWKQFTLFQRGVKLSSNCQKAPITCGLIERFRDAAECSRGQVKFSVLQPNTHIWPHTGPTNCRLRSHLGLKVPGGAYITVAKETKEWAEGKIIILDDSFEHEVWHNGTEVRVILIIDFWHPDLTSWQKQGLRPI